MAKTFVALTEAPPSSIDLSEAPNPNGSTIYLDGKPPAPRRSGNAGEVGALVLTDMVALLLTFWMATFLRFEFFSGNPSKSVDYSLLVLIFTPVWIGVFFFYGMYEARRTLNVVAELKTIFHGVLAGAIAILVTDSLFELDLARGWILATALSGLFIVGGARLTLRKTTHYLHRRGTKLTKILVVGANEEGKTVARTLDREGWLGYEIVGFVDNEVSGDMPIANGHSVLGPTSALKSLIDEHDIGLVVVAASAFPMEELNRLFWELRNYDVHLQVTSGTIDFMASRIVVQSVGGIPLLYVRKPGMDRLRRFGNRAFDVVGALFGLLVLSPVFAALAIWIRKDSKGKVFFTQERVGRDGATFKIHKFRTMCEDAEDQLKDLAHLSEGAGLLFKMKNDPRITDIGAFLRRYSLDELPQLWDVLRGDMSLVGPRPALPSEVEQYDGWVRNRLAVKPGMTGLWQVSGRSETDFSDYVRYDLFYIQNWSLSLDLWILWRTLGAVRSAEGAA